jgi:hypothetical protein
MSFPAEFVQPPNEEVEKTGQKMAIPVAESTDEVKAFSGEKKKASASGTMALLLGSSLYPLIPP